MGFDQGRITRDPYNVHNMPYGSEWSTTRAAAVELEYDHAPSTQDRAAAWAVPKSEAHHHGQGDP